MKVYDFNVVDEVSNEDTRFLKVEIDVLHTGLNFNECVFDKDVVDENIDTIKNIPILGYISTDDKDIDFQGHEYKLTKKNNNLEYVYIGSAYGTVPEDCNPRWITKLCDDGEEREFLRVDGLIWRKFDDAVDILTRDVVKGHSMELEMNSVEGYDDDDGIFHYTKFAFEGLCMLGDDAEPAMINSKIELQFEVNDFMKKIQSELIHKYNTFTKLMEEKTNSKGGFSTMPKTNNFTLSHQQKFEEVCKQVHSFETLTDEWGYTYPRYYAVDLQDNEVIVKDASNNYEIYGFSYSEDGDNVTIDFSSGERKKITYENYVDGTSQEEKEVSEVAFNFEDEVISKIKEFYSTKIKEFETNISEITAQKDEVTNNYEEVKTKLEEIEPRYNEFVKADEQRKADEINEEKNSILTEFEKQLSDVEEFKTIKENKDELSIDEIESKCSVLYYKKSIKNNFSKSNDDSKIGIPDFTDESDDGENYIQTKYGYIRTSK